MIRSHWRPWFQRYKPGLVVVGIIAIAVIVILRQRRGEKESAPPLTTPANTGGAAMSGMAGMSASSDGSVKLTAEQIRQFGVTFGTVELRPLSSEVRTVGSVVADETRMAKVTPKFAGYIQTLYVNSTGQPVRRGQPLAAVFSPDLLAAEQELLVAARLSRTIGNSAVPGVAGTTIDLVAAARQRLRLWDVSETQINEVLRTGRPIRTVTLFAPVSGVVIEKKVLQGQAIQAGDELYTIADLSDVWVEAELREGDAGRVAPGTTAAVELTSFPGRPITGRISYVYPTLTSQTRTVKARIVVPNPGGRVKPGMYATVVLATGTQSALSVPRTAVVQTGERALVFVDMGGGQLMPHTVVIGRTGSEYVEILSGATRGQRVVTSAQFLIDSESNLGELMKGMTGMGQPMPGTSKEAPSLDTKGADMRGMPGMSPPPGKSNR